MSHKQVVSEIVDHDLCIGCGICAGVCPSNILDMDWKLNGDLAPSIEGECPPSCSACLQVCPFADESSSEDELSLINFGDIDDAYKDEEAGYFLKGYAGYSLTPSHREDGASGGMMTWFLENLLSKDYVDSVVSVKQSNADEKLFEYKISDDIESIKSMSGSVYHPVEMSEIVAKINARHNEKRYAVVGLPCFLKGLSLSMQIMPRVKRRVVYTLGLACGHLPNKFYTQYLSKLSGVDSKDLLSVEYRRKENTKRAGDFIFRALNHDLESGSEIPFTDVSNIWGSGYFGFNACNYCDDIFSEVADLCLMDAWLPNYEKDTKGHSMLIVRNPNLLPLIESGIKENSCHLEQISIEEIKDSQRGVIHHKRDMLGARLFFSELKGKKTPIKRVKPDEKTYRSNSWKVKARFSVQNASKKYWERMKIKYFLIFKSYIYFLSVPIVFHRFYERFKKVLKRPSLLLKFFKGK